MIRITIGTNTNRKVVTASVTASVAEVLEENNVSTEGASVHLDGSIVTSSELNSSFEELGIEDESDVSLIAVVKADSAR